MTPDVMKTDTISDIYLPPPSETEKQTIVRHLDHETTHLDALLTKVREAIARLTELRTALISAAVTGRIDVREEVA